MQKFQFHPAVNRWFEEAFRTPTDPQRLGWPAIQAGRHALIAAPTGSGKTLAAFLAALDGLFRQGAAGTLADETSVLYVSPLKALSNDIHKNLEVPLAGIRKVFSEMEGKDIAIRSAVRTGDTSPGARQSMIRKPPHILVTTPESLYLLLTSASGRKMLATVRSVIVDEIHALAPNRRGAHLALSLERLQALVQKPLQRIGLSATQKPIEEVARFLLGARQQDCAIIDTGHKRELDLAIELPGSPLEAVMSNEVWAEVYRRLGELIGQHRTTLIFVNTRRMAERVTHHLAALLGQDQVTSHHGSLSAKLRLDAELRLKRGELKALVATSSLELGIDIGAVDLVCQLGPCRSIAACLQRVGRAEHHHGGLPKGRLFPLTRDELVEILATIRSIREGGLDRLHIPEKPLDILAQQIAASAAAGEWPADELFDTMRSAWPYRNLARAEFDEIIRVLAEGFHTRRGRRAALLHYDAVHRRVRARRGTRLVALTSGGAIADNTDYRVILEPGETFIGTVNEDFAVESLAGDIFQLGNASWRIRRISAGAVRVEDAKGQPPGIPFWLGEAPARTDELSAAISQWREEAARHVNGLEAWLQSDGLYESGARQLADYLTQTHRALGVLPSQNTIVMERFFDESGGMQLVIHSPFGARINRAWGLALRKRFCRSFNFELQSAATDDAIVLSLGTQHSFPLDEVFRYLHSNSVRPLLVQALLDSPMFPIRWRWNATRALAIPRFRNGHKLAAPLARMESENLLAAVFPDQLACLENIAGDREIPDHPLVRQTIDDCLTEAMDIAGLETLLRRIENGEIQCVARDLPEPSPFAHEILHARPYAFLDNAPLEERRTQAVYTRRAGEPANGEALGILDPAALDRVCEDAWPRATNPDELHEALLLAGLMTEEELHRCAYGATASLENLDIGRPKSGEAAAAFVENLVTAHRIGRLPMDKPLWFAAERWPLIQSVYPGITASPAPAAVPDPKQWDRSSALRELARGRLEISGPVSQHDLAGFFGVPGAEIEQALLALEGEGFALRGSFHPKATAIEWCDRRLLARIHRLTINRLREEIRPVSLAEYQRFLFSWQRLSPETRAHGPEGVEAVLHLFDGYEMAAGAWEPALLASRVRDYSPEWLDQLCLTGRIGWGRLSSPAVAAKRPASPLRSSPISLFARENLPHWLALSGEPPARDLPADADAVLQVLSSGGALFFSEICHRANLLKSSVEQALGELVALGIVTSDSFAGLRGLLAPAAKRAPFGDLSRKRHHRQVPTIEFAGRWSLLRSAPGAREEAVEVFARVLLRRYGVVFRRLLEREALAATWFELDRIYRRMEARGEIRGGYFINGIGGGQYALPEAVTSLRSIRKEKAEGQIIGLSAADPLNLAGIVTPGPRVPALRSNRLLYRGGEAVAALEAGQTVALNTACLDADLERQLKVTALPPPLRLYY